MDESKSPTQSSKTKFFTQVQRTTAISSTDIDPLSMFANEEPLPPQDVDDSIQTSIEKTANIIQAKVSTILFGTTTPPPAAKGLDSKVSVGACLDEAPLEEVEEIPLFTGEQKLMSLKDAFIQLAPNRLIPGIMYMTTYRISFVPSPMHLATIAATNPSVHAWLNVPLACIDRIEKEKKVKDSRVSGVTLVVSCKDVRVHRITFNSKSHDDAEIDKALSVILAYAFPNNMKYLFAFSHSLPSRPQSLSIVEQFDVTQEFSRQGILDGGDAENCQWRMSGANLDYRLCDTYPQILLVPKRITDDDLPLVANFRAGHRFPVMCWGHRENGATLWRSSQPKAGVSGSCIHDEKYLSLIAQSCVVKKNPLGITKVVGTPLLHIVDCRPKASAMANRAAGAGYESQTNYPSSKLEFYNIGNIHVMRDSFRALAGLFTKQNQPDSCYFSKQVEDTQWLTHVRLVIKASWDTACFIRKGAPVLVHCSHGWDRTAQVCALSQLFLDPFYRTIDGFKILVEKEWNSFGHQFQMRCGHSQDRTSRQDDQLSPIFLQFLECVWQIQRQHPHYFEFNARYILTIADHIYSGRFSTFLFSSDRDRDAVGARQRCLDIWTYLHYNRPCLTNPLYMDPNAENTPTTHILLPSITTLLRNVTLWTDYFFRWSSIPCILSAPDLLNKHLNDNGLCQSPWYSSSEMISQWVMPAGVGSSISEDCAVAPVATRRCIDLEVPAMVTCDDFWEGAFKRERSRAERGRGSSNDVTATGSDAAYRSFDGALDASAHHKSDERRTKEVAAKNNIIDCQQNVIEKLVQMLKEAGTAQEDIAEVLQLAAMPDTDSGLTNMLSLNGGSDSQTDMSMTGAGRDEGGAGEEEDDNEVAEPNGRVLMDGEAVESAHHSLAQPVEQEEEEEKYENSDNSLAFLL